MVKRQKKKLAVEKLKDDKAIHAILSPSPDARAKQAQRFADRKLQAPIAPRYITEINDDVAEVRMEDGAENRIALMEASGTTNDIFAQKLVGDLSGAICNTASEGDGHTLNAGLAALAGIAPRDEIEGMLAAQMVATHKAGMKMMGRAMRATTLEAAQWQSSFAVKLMRTFTMQMDVIQRYRGKGEQKMTVEHVHVHSGGQAIVGHVHPAGGVGMQQKMEEQPHAKQIEYQPTINAPLPTLPSENETKTPMPVPSDGKRTLPNARRQIHRSTKGK